MGMGGKKHRKARGMNKKNEQIALIASLNRMMFGCRRDLWFMISLATFSSICKSYKANQSSVIGEGDRSTRKRTGNCNLSRNKLHLIQTVGMNETRDADHRTFRPRSMYFMATSSLVSLWRISLATPKFPAPKSFTTS